MRFEFFVADFYPRCNIALMNVPHNIYIHVPFCMSKCNYCAFFSRACSNPDWQKYANDICDELNIKLEASLLPKQEIVKEELQEEVKIEEKPKGKIKSIFRRK